MTRITNFGGNIGFTPAELVAVKDEAEVLALLARGHGRKIRVLGRGHSWSGIYTAADIAVDMQCMNRVAIDDNPRAPRVTVEAGCTLGHLIEVLNEHGLTLPTLGSVTRQSMAGALATGTHGSGAPSLSHYVIAMRIATYDPDTGAPIIAVFDERDPIALKAARCNLGALGIVVSLTFPCRRQYLLQERVSVRATLDEVLTERQQWPLQQFGLIPYCWKYLVYDRQPIKDLGSPFKAWYYRTYKLIFVDYLLHAFAKGILSRPALAGFARLFFARLLPLIVKKGTFRDQSEEILTMRHDFFRHVEMEVFVPETRLEEALELTRQVITAAAFGTMDTQFMTQVDKVAGAGALLEQIKGRYTFHYVVFCRRVLADDTLLSMSSGEQTYYSFSFFTFHKANENYATFCNLLASLMTDLLGARLHWGKFFPLPVAQVAAHYDDRVKEFADLCLRFDPAGVFDNPFIEDLIGQRSAPTQ